MANVLVNDLYLSDIADAIREKLDTEDTYKPSEMANAIDSISGGGGSSLGTKSITANGTYNASSDSLDGYSQVTVNVPTGTAKSSSDLTANNLTVTAPAGLYSSDASKTLTDANLTAGNIKKDVTIFGVTGSYEGGGGGGSGITKVTGTVTGSGTNTIAIASSKAPDIINIYRSDINNLTAVADRAVASMVFWSGGTGGSTYTLAAGTTVSNAGALYNSGIGSGTTPGNNTASYSNGNVYLKGGNNSTLWSSSLTYNYEFIFFS